MLNPNSTIYLTSLLTQQVPFYMYVSVMNFPALAEMNPSTSLIFYVSLLAFISNARKLTGHWISSSSSLKDEMRI